MKKDIYLVSSESLLYALIFGRNMLIYIYIYIYIGSLQPMKYSTYFYGKEPY